MQLIIVSFLLFAISCGLLCDGRETNSAPERSLDSYLKDACTQANKDQHNGKPLIVVDAAADEYGSGDTKVAFEYEANCNRMLKRTVRSCKLMVNGVGITDLSLNPVSYSKTVDVSLLKLNIKLACEFTCRAKTAATLLNCTQ